MNAPPIPLRRATAALLWMSIVMGMFGCSRFENSWRAAAAVPPPTNDITGRWVGTWQNEGNGHSGKLRALVSRLDDSRVLAQYHATYTLIVLPLTYESLVVLEGRRSGDRVEFTGEADLGRLAGGVYTYEGHATPAEFISNYSSKHNTGVYTLHRPGPDDRP